MDEKKQIEELQADRTSDRLIAERLGFEVFEMWSFAGKAELGIILDSDKGIESCPPYTTSLDAAWSLFDDVQRDLFELELDKISEGIHAKIYDSARWDRRVFGGIADSPALAVCRAWWAWMDAKEREA